MISVFIGLGSNVEDAERRLREATSALRRLPDAHLAEESPLYRTQPQGLARQAWFANQVTRLRCGSGWTAFGLLQSLLEMERAMGRVRSPDPALRFGPRGIDLDLLLFGGESSEDPQCTLPHPRMLERAFVLVPLRDIAPRVVLPGGLTPDAALSRLEYRVLGNRIFQRETPS